MSTENNSASKSRRVNHLDLPLLLGMASKLAPVGKLVMTNNYFTYLDVDDDYIHELFPLLKNQKIKKPDYFGESAAGAHISVIYPEENIKVRKEDLGQKHSFVIKNLVVADAELKTYYALLVESPSLLAIRRKYGLSDNLSFKGQTMGFHITLGVVHLDY